MHVERYFSLFVLILSSLSLASTAQTYPDQACRRVNSKMSAVVSVASLRMPAAAKKHFEKAREAMVANDMEVFRREAAETLAIAPNYAEVYLLRGSLQVRNGLDERAISSIETARTLQPEIAFASLVVASALMHLARYDEASSELDRFHSMNENWQWEFEKTRAELGRHNLDGALHWSQLAEQDAPEGCAVTHLLRIDALEMADLKDQAIAAMEVYLASGKNLAQHDAVLRLLAKDRKMVEENPAALVARR
jgi:tetratricopeptide (TPR) repeat protein